MAMELSKVYDRVQRGAAWLDEKIPGWEQQIDLDLLDVGSVENCILGQLGHGRVGSMAEECLCRACGHLGARLGFEAEGDHSQRYAEYGRLTIAWDAVITWRRRPIHKAATDLGYFLTRRSGEYITPAMAELEMKRELELSAG